MAHRQAQACAARHGAHMELTYATCGLLFHPAGPSAGPEPKLMPLSSRSLQSRVYP